MRVRRIAAALRRRLRRLARAGVRSRWQGRARDFASGTADAADGACYEPCDASLERWPGGRRGAVTINYDSPEPESARDREARELVRQNGLGIDYEVVTASYPPGSERAALLKETLAEPGVGCFGHGHEHVDHDALPADAAARSFRQCFEGMTALGLTPVSYAYPTGAGNLVRTRGALAAAGFLCGRLHSPAHRDRVWIVPDGVDEPDDWYALPTLVMQSRAFRNNPRVVSGTAELDPFLDTAVRKGAWLILTYHAIGKPDQWGYYEMEPFGTDLAAIAGRDLWPASLDAATVYVQARAAASAAARRVVDGGGRTVRIEVTVVGPPLEPRHRVPLCVRVRLPEDLAGRTLRWTTPAGVDHRETAGRDVRVEVPPRGAVLGLEPGAHGA